MSRFLGVVCAGVLVLAPAGCMGPSFLASQGSARYRQVADGTVAQVAAELEAGLRQEGISVLTKRVDGEIRLAGQAASGTIFCLDVKPEKAEHGNKAAVCARWDRGPDDQLWQMVTAILKVGDAVGDNP